MENVLSKGFVEVSENEMQEVEGGIFVLIDCAVYGVDLYGYYCEMARVTTYNETVTEAGRGDLVKPNPEKPEYSIGYVFTR